MKPTIAALAFLLPTAALAQPVCQPSAEMEAALIDWYAESPQGPMDGRTQLWASDAGTWTLVEYRGDGTACAIASGADGAAPASADVVAALDAPAAD
ncbi:MAG: S-adenosyl-L-homocysteine hydrolase [Pseudomonadota bacterium]